MNFSKVFGIFSIIAAVLLLGGILLLVIDSKSATCSDNPVFDTPNHENTGWCYYFLEEDAKCKAQETLKILNDKNSCFYEPRSIISSKIITWGLSFLGISWGLIFLVFLFSSMKHYKPIELSEFKEKERLSSDEAKRLWCLWYALQDGTIPVINDQYKKSAFNITKSSPTRKGKEWFVKFEVEIKDGETPEIYTVVGSLSRGKDWILQGNFNYKQCMYDDYKMERDWNIHVPENMQERMLDNMFEVQPERAMDLQQQIMEQNILHPPTPPPEPPPEQQTTQQPVMMPRRGGYGGGYPWRRRRRY